MSTKNVDYSKEFTCISLCTGYGGIEIGLKRVVPNFRTIVYVERECFAVANLVAKIEAGLLDSAPIWTDVKTFNGCPFRGKVDIIVGGYPCQGFSIAGKRLGADDPRHLWPHIARIIEAVRPAWCFFENVEGHLSLGFPEVLQSLRNLGYKVEAGIFSAAECGAPHRRKRLFVLANYTRGRCKTGEVKQGWKTTPELVCDVANTGGTEHEGWQGQQGNDDEELSSLAGTCDKWPARPGQPQYEWEEPRVVDDSRGKKRTRLSNNERQTISEIRETSPRILDDTKQRTLRTKYKNKQQRQKQSNALTRTITSRNKPEGQAQSGVGRAAYGTSSRLDRLRLLGNGVVPQQAEKAFRCLISKFYEPNTSGRLD